MGNLYNHFCWFYNVEICPFKEINRTKYNLHYFATFPFLVNNAEQQILWGNFCPHSYKIQIFQHKYDQREI